jgi:hypothetical protein
MSSTICGACNLNWHTQRDCHGGVSGQIWSAEHGYHQWQAPTKQQIAERLRKKYDELRSRGTGSTSSKART